MPCCSPFGQLFEVYGSKLKPHPAGDLGQTAGKRIAHTVLFFGIGRSLLNGFPSFGIKILVFRADRAVIVFTINIFSPLVSARYPHGALAGGGRPVQKGFCFDVSKRRGANRPRRSSTRRRPYRGSRGNAGSAPPRQAHKIFSKRTPGLPLRLDLTVQYML